MSHVLIKNLMNFCNHVELFIINIFKQTPPPPCGFAVVTVSSQYNQAHLYPNSHNNLKEYLKDILNDGILWAVPKHRRTIEKRLNRKFGHPLYNWKPLRVKSHLRNCNQCGHDYEAGHLCTFCYNKIREETTQMQEKIQEELGLNPIEQEVVVLYEGERKHQPKEILNGKRIVEMLKPRPLWFSKNLLQKSTQQTSKSKEVKPNDLA